MLEADLRDAIADANDLGHFFLLMEHKGYELHHGNRLGFRLRGQERFMYPERKNAAFSEETSNAPLQAISRRLKPVSDRRSSRAQSPSHTAHIPNTRASLLCTTITDICLDALRSGSIRRA